MAFQLVVMASQPKKKLTLQSSTKISIHAKIKFKIMTIYLTENQTLNRIIFDIKFYFC